LALQLEWKQSFPLEGKGRKKKGKQKGRKKEIVYSVLYEK
jgi:hypothetical protein